MAPFMKIACEGEHHLVGFYVLKLIVCKEKIYSIFNKVIIVVYSVKIVIE